MAERDAEIIASGYDEVADEYEALESARGALASSGACARLRG